MTGPFAAPGLPGSPHLTGPFAALGLPASPHLTDDDVRAAWRRFAAATHPDRADGGDPAAFAAAAAAYAMLRTEASRGEVLAVRAGPEPSRPEASWPKPTRPEHGLAAWIRRGRPARLGGRVLAAAATGSLAVAAVGWQPAAVAVIAGAATWLALTCRGDLAPPRRHR